MPRKHARRVAVVAAFRGSLSHLLLLRSVPSCLAPGSRLHAGCGADADDCWQDLEGEVRSGEWQEVVVSCLPPQRTSSRGAFSGTRRRRHWTIGLGVYHAIGPLSPIHEGACSKLPALVFGVDLPGPLSGPSFFSLSGGEHRLGPLPGSLGQHCHRGSACLVVSFCSRLFACLCCIQLTTVQKQVGAGFFGGRGW